MQRVKKNPLFTRVHGTHSHYAFLAFSSLTIANGRKCLIADKSPCHVPVEVAVFSIKSLAKRQHCEERHHDGGCADLVVVAEL